MKSEKSNLIDRQAMLKYIEKKRQDALMIDDLRESSLIMLSMKLGEEVVRNQPSAQPEIIRCDDDYCSCGVAKGGEVKWV